MPQDSLFSLDEVEEAPSSAIFVISNEGSLTMSLSEARNFLRLGFRFTALTAVLLQELLFILFCKREGKKNFLSKDKKRDKFYANPIVKKQKGK